MGADAVVLFNEGEHCNVLLPDCRRAVGRAAHRHLVVHGDQAALLEPGLSGCFGQVMSATLRQLRPGVRLRHVVVSHDAHDAGVAVNGWLMATEADAWAPYHWSLQTLEGAFDPLVLGRLYAVPDEGLCLPLGDCGLLILPAHFLHSTSNFHLYDPVGRVLYTGPLGSSAGHDYLEVRDFEAHVPFMEPFHRRHMTSSSALRAWVRMARELDIDVVAPEQGAMLRGAGVVQRFLDWCEQLECGIDAMPYLYRTPG